MPEITAADLRDTARLIELLPVYLKAWPKVFASLPDPRLTLVAMAEYSLQAADKHPGALFVSNVSHGRWLFISDVAEQRAQRRLAAYDRKQSANAGACEEPGDEAQVALSEDARLALNAITMRANGSTPLNPFHILRGGGGWDRPRFDAAVTELKAAGALGAAHLQVIGGEK